MQRRGLGVHARLRRRAAGLPALVEEYDELLAGRFCDLHLPTLAAGTLRVNIETAIPLDRAPEAFAAFADGTLGKVLITR